MASFTSNAGIIGQNAGQNSPANFPSFGSNTGNFGQNAEQNSPSNFPSFGSNAGALGQKAGQNSPANFPSFNSFGGVGDNQPFFGGQQDFAQMDNQFSFNTGFSDGSLGANQTFESGVPNQPSANPGAANSVSQQLFGQPPSPRQRWQAAPPKDQNR